MSLAWVRVANLQLILRNTRYGERGRFQIGKSAQIRRPVRDKTNRAPRVDGSIGREIIIERKVLAGPSGHYQIPFWLGPNVGVVSPRTHVAF